MGAIVFVCLITEASPDRFRLALQSLLAHLATVHVWALLVVFTPSLGRLTRAYQMMVHDELESPLSDDDVQGLWRLFLRWREGARTEPWWQPLPGVAAAGDALRTRLRYRALFRHWTEVDDAAFEPLRLTTAADAIAAGRGRVGYRTLAQEYDHLTPVADHGAADLPVGRGTAAGTHRPYRLNPPAEPPRPHGRIASYPDPGDRRGCDHEAQPQARQAHADQAQLSLFAVSQRRGSSG